MIQYIFILFKQKNDMQKNCKVIKIMDDTKSLTLKSAVFHYIKIYLYSVNS